MPLRRRQAPLTRGGIAHQKVYESLLLVGALALVKPWTAVHSFVVPGGTRGAIFVDGGALTSASSAVAGRRRTAPVRARNGGRDWKGLAQGRDRLAGVIIRASLDDEEDGEFDPDAWTDRLDDEEVEDDMGMGVSNTIKRKRAPDPKYVNSEYAENAILDLATATQSVMDKIQKEEREMEEQRRAAEEERAAAAAAVEDENEEDDLGMGVSEVVPTPKSGVRSFGEGGSRFGEAMSAMQGAEEAREMKALTARDQKRAEMEQRGLSQEQISAYLGDVSSAAPPKTKAEEARARAEAANARAFEKFNQAAFVESNSWRAEEDLLKVVPSSSLVRTDENGEPYQDRFVYVDEYTCIGCTHCNHEAPSTFFMEEEYGRARVYQQGRDTEEAVCSAILTCPVDCIHYVDWPELVRLEKERDGIDINFKAKLVGNDHDNMANGMQVISGNQGMRCDNCPSKGCYNCPMFSVGNNPEYKKRKEERKAKRIAKRRMEKEALSGEVKKAEL